MPPEDQTQTAPPERFDLLQALQDDNYVAQWDSAHPNAGPRAFSNSLNNKLSTRIDTGAGESIFDPQVMSRYFDDPSIPDADKQAISFAFKPSLAVAAYDEQLRQSIGEPVRSKGLLSRAISSTIDIAGKPIGKVFDALQWPSDKTEQLFGTVLSYGYDSDLSLSERWQMGRLTYEAYSDSGWWKFNGDDRLNEWSQQVASGEKTIDDLMAENEYGVGDLVGKVILDPLWLLGGLPAVPGKLFKTGEKGAEVYKAGVAASFFRGLSEGIRMESLGAPGIKVAESLRGVPVVGKPAYKVGRLLFGETLPSEQKILNNAIADWRTILRAEDVGPTLASARSGKGLFQLTPQARADEAFNHLTLATTLARGNQDDIIQLARAVEAQDLNAVPEVFGNAFRSKAGRIVFAALKDQGVDFRRFPSLMKGIAPDPAAWDAASKLGDEGAKELIARTHRDPDAFVSAFMEDLHNIAYPSMQQWHGVEGAVERVKLKSGEVVEKFMPRPSAIQKFTNGMKFWLSTTLLNRPGFVGLNYANNGATLSADWGLGRAAKYWVDPLGRKGHLEGGLKDLLEAAGINPDVVRSIVGDRSVQRELLGLNAADDKLLGISKTWWSPMVTLTSKFDMGARMHAFYEMFGRAHNAVWKFEGTAHGVLPNVPDALAAQLGPDIAARLRGAILAAGPDAEKLRAIADGIQRFGRPPLTAEHFIEKMADELKLEGDACQAFNDMFEPAFRTRVSAILADAGSDSARLRRRMDTLRGALRQQEHQARELDQLMPRPRDYRNLPVAAADHEALMAERDKELLIQLRRYTVATGMPNVDQALRGFGEWQNAARTRRYTLQYVAQLLDVAPDRLESDVMFQMVPEYLRPAVRDAHRELVLGLDEVIPERGEFFEVLGDLAARWEKHTDETVGSLTDFVNGIDGELPQPLVDFFSSVARAEGDAAANRDRLFARLIDNHPGADAATDVAEWISSRWSEHYGELDNLYNDALNREASIFGFEHRFPPHARAGENPMVGEMLGVRNSQLEQYLDYVEKQHLIEKDTHVFSSTQDTGDLVTVYHGAGGPLEGDTLREGTFVTTDRAAAEKYAEVDARARQATGERGAKATVNEWKVPRADLGDAPADATNLGSPFVLKNAATRRAAGFVGSLDELRTYLDDIAAIAPDAAYLRAKIARGAADFTMLNYDRRYGIDHWMALVYPYAFWPTRSMWHWAQRGISRPGAVAATAKLYDLIGDINQDAGIPQRFRNSVRVPIPFLNQLTGQQGSFYFDPIKVLFPTADWSYDDNFDQAEGAQGSFFGVPRNTIAAVNQWAKVVGPGVNPFIDTALQYAAGDERALYLKYRFSAMPFIIPGPRQLQSMYSFLQSGEDPDGQLDDDTKERLALGQHLPEDKLKQVLAMSDDEFDLYRTQRVLANQVGEYMKQGRSIEERKAFVREALDAMFTRKGRTWNNARKLGKKEGGLSVVTGWLFGMPIRQYPNGEATSRGIQELYRQVQEDSRAKGGGDMTAAFTEMFPEIEVRDAALAIFDGTDKQDQEIAGSLFATDLDRVHKQYDQRIADLNAQLESLARQGVLKTEEGRRAFDVLETERNALTQQRSLEIDDLDKRYESRNQEPSLSRTPRTRALQELERAYYAIELPENATGLDFQKQKAAQQAFLESLPTESSYSPFGDAVNHYAQTKKFDREITAAYDAGERDKAEKLIEQRTTLIKDRTAETKAQVTRKEFERYINRNKRTPTSEELERDQASEQISQYFAIKDRATEIGYSSKEANELARVYWEQHPLLEKYYGGDVPFQVRSYEDIAAYDRMEAIWEQFYSLEGSSQARIDYLAMVLDELNGLRSRFGLKPVRLNDPYWNQDPLPPKYEGSNPGGY